MCGLGKYGPILRYDRLLTYGLPAPMFNPKPEAQAFGEAARMPTIASGFGSNEETVSRSWSSLA
jgi:hypothetical protein